MAAALALSLAVHAAAGAGKRPCRIARKGHDVGIVARGQRQQPRDPHDPSTPILFTTFVEALVHLSHHKVNYCAGAAPSAHGDASAPP
eukprot:gene20797-54633_t